MLCSNKNGKSVFQATCGNFTAQTATTGRVHGASSVERPYLGERLVVPMRHGIPGPAGTRLRSDLGRAASPDAAQPPFRDTSLCATLSRPAEDVLNTAWAVLVIGRAMSS